MLASLHCHPETPTDAVSTIDVELKRLAARRIRLHFVVVGRIRHLELPAWRPGRRVDDLWRHTCFEAFVRAGDSDAYYEFNFAPSSDWASYRFSDYREGMEIPGRIEGAGQGLVENKPVDDFQRKRRQMEGFTTIDRYTPPFYWHMATLELKQAVDLPLDWPWRLGLSAVIEERNGRKSYWALNHPPGKPDFHHRDCFALELPAARPA